MAVCRRCNGTGIDPGEYIEEDGRRYLLDRSKHCVRCNAPLMFGDPGHGVWHCSAIAKNDPNWMDHFAISRVYTEAER